MIYRHEKHGKLTQEPSGGFDAEKAKAQFAANVKKKQGGTPRRAKLPKQTGSDHGQLAGLPAAIPSASQSLMIRIGQAWRRPNSSTSVQRTKLQGKYVDAIEAEKAWTDYITAVRNRLLEMPDARVLS
jgi:hypothetical protein